MSTQKIKEMPLALLERFEYNGNYMYVRDIMVDSTTNEEYAVVVEVGHTFPLYKLTLADMDKVKRGVDIDDVVFSKTPPKVNVSEAKRRSILSKFGLM